MRSHAESAVDITACLMRREGSHGQSVAVQSLTEIKVGDISGRLYLVFSRTQDTATCEVVHWPLLCYLRSGDDITSSEH